MVKVCRWCYQESFDSLTLTLFRVYLDTTDLQGVRGGKLYADYGLTEDGAIAVVRPDGFVSFISPLDGVEELNAYFATFMIQQS